MNNKKEHCNKERRRFFSNRVYQHFGAFFVLWSFAMWVTAQTDYHPNERFINTTITVIDTAQAERLFQPIRDSLLIDYEKGKAKLKRCQDLHSSNISKVKTKEEKDMLLQAYCYCWTNKQEIIAKIYGEKMRKKMFNNALLQSFFSPLPIMKSKDLTKDLITDDGHIRYEGEKITYNGQEIVVIDKDIIKGKLTPNVLLFLDTYNSFLADSIQTVYDNIELGWHQWSPSELPYKKVSQTVQNPYYRGNNYKDDKILNLVDRYQQGKGGDFFYEGTRTYKEDTYPTKFKYYIYTNHPQYKVDSEELDVYNTNGQLVYVNSLMRSDKNVFEEIKRVLFLRDYQNNKYGIKSQSKRTQEFLNRVLGQERGIEYFGYDKAIFSIGSAAMLSPLAALLGDSDLRKMSPQQRLSAVGDMQDWLHDTHGENFIKQLEQDHECDLGYIYMIERVSNISFRVVYIDSCSLKPSWCALIIFRTSTKPYTKTFSAELIAMPDNIPPIRDKDGILYKTIVY